MKFLKKTLIKKKKPITIINNYIVFFRLKRNNVGPHSFIISINVSVDRRVENVLKYIMNISLYGEYWSVIIRVRMFVTFVYFFF